MWDCSLLAEPIQSVKMHFKVLLCYDLENILLQLCLYWCEFYFSFSISEGLQFCSLFLILQWKFVFVSTFRFVHTLCIQCAFLRSDWSIHWFSPAVLRYNSRLPLVLDPLVRVCVYIFKCLSSPSLKHANSLLYISRTWFWIFFF